jgi:hypothetical protein
MVAMNQNMESTVEVQATSLAKKNYIIVLYPKNKFITNFKWLEPSNYN